MDKDKERQMAGIPQLGKAVLLVCDMQEKFRNAVQHFDKIAKICNRLTTAATILKIPYAVTEQYPQGLGKTVSEIDISHAGVVVPKTKFTMYNSEIYKWMNETTHEGVREPTDVILCGVETHVCIQQTVIDFKRAGFNVYVVADATSSRNHDDRCVALERFRQQGAFVTTSEAILFQLIQDKEHPDFKAIQKLIIETVPTGLYPEGKY